MRSRLFFLAVAAFFITMNVLLWRSEFAPSSRLGTLPADVVWEKLVTSPDDSWLDIRHHGTKIGRTHWIAKINEEFPEEDEIALDLPPEGMVRQVTGYTLDFGGTVSLDESTRLRFDLGLTLDTNRVWQSLNVRLLIKPFSLAVRASARDRQVRITVEEESKKEHVYSFDELRNPDRLLRDLGGPLLPAALSPFLLPLRQVDPSPAALAWAARHDRLPVGRSDIRVYRLEARLLDRYRVVFLVSPVGEVLRIELPGEIVLINDALINL